MDLHADLARRLAEDVVFVAVQPQQPGNVGGIARAMKNMGLRRLVIVDPAPSFDPERARWMAPGADDVLAAARIVGTLEDALDGVHHVVGTTARHRADGQPVIEPDGLADRIFDGEGVTAVLFGREDTGLARAQTLRCEALLRIPTDHHASLNLAQASLLVAARLFEGARARGLAAEGRLLGGRRGTRSTSSMGGRRQDALATVGAIEPAVADLMGLLERVGYLRAGDPDRTAVMLREAIQRAEVSERHVAAMRGMVARVEYALEHPGVDWRRRSGDGGG